MFISKFAVILYISSKEPVTLTWLNLSLHQTYMSVLVFKCPFKNYTANSYFISLSNLVFLNKSKYLLFLLYLAVWMAMGKLDFLIAEIFLLESLKLTRHMESIKWQSSENMVRSQDKLYSMFPGDPEKKKKKKMM